MNKALQFVAEREQVRDADGEGDQLLRVAQVKLGADSVQDIRVRQLRGGVEVRGSGGSVCTQGAHLLSTRDLLWQ